jgi:hypothetical protein
MDAGMGYMGKAMDGWMMMGDYLAKISFTTSTRYDILQLPTKWDCIWFYAFSVSTSHLYPSDRYLVLSLGKGTDGGGGVQVRRLEM